MDQPLSAAKGPLRAARGHSPSVSRPWVRPDMLAVRPTVLLGVFSQNFNPFIFVLFASIL
jgi:hypothetical protein